MEVFAALFNEMFGALLLLIWIVPPVLLLAAYLLYIAIQTIREFRKK